MAFAPLLIFATTLALASSAPGGGALPPARLEVLEGRATLASGASLRSVLPEDGALADLAPSYLETGAVSRVSLRFNGAASLMLFGPAACEWAAGSGRAALACRLFSFDAAHLEVRRGPVSVSLPGGWTAQVENAALVLGTRPGGGFVLRHDAGSPILLSQPCERTRARPPLTILPGARIAFAGGGERPRASGQSRMRLLDPFGRPEALALESRPTAPPWASFSWPWRDAEPLVRR